MSRPTFKTILADTFALALALPASSVLAAPTKDCILSQVGYVQPQNAQVQQGKFLRQRLVGATLSIPAQPGLTTDWLKRQVDEHQARMGGRLSAILRSQPSFGRPNFAALAET